MAKSKQGRQNKSVQKDGQYRKESKDERKARLKRQEQAREACERVLPYAAGAIVLFLLVFVFIVRSVPPKVPKADATTTTSTAYQGEIPEYFNMDTKDMVKDAMDEAEQAMKKNQARNDEEMMTMKEPRSPDNTLEL